MPLAPPIDDTEENVALLIAVEVRSIAAPPVALIELVAPKVIVPALTAFRPKPPSVVIDVLPRVKLLVAPMPVERSMPLPLWPLPTALSVTVVEVPRLKLALAAVLETWIA